MMDGSDTDAGVERVGSDKRKRPVLALTCIAIFLVVIAIVGQSIDRAIGTQHLTGPATAGKGVSSFPGFVDAVGANDDLDLRLTLTVSALPTHAVVFQSSAALPALRIELVENGSLDLSIGPDAGPQQIVVVPKVIVGEAYKIRVRSTFGTRFAVTVNGLTSTIMTVQPTELHFDNVFLGGGSDKEWPLPGAVSGFSLVVHQHSTLLPYWSAVLAVLAAFAVMTFVGLSVMEQGSSQQVMARVGSVLRLIARARTRWLAVTLVAGLSLVVVGTAWHPLMETVTRKSFVSPSGASSSDPQPSDSFSAMERSRYSNSGDLDMDLHLEIRTTNTTSGYVLDLRDPATAGSTDFGVYAVRGRVSVSIPLKNFEQDSSPFVGTTVGDWHAIDFRVRDGRTTSLSIDGVLQWAFRWDTARVAVVVPDVYRSTVTDAQVRNYRLSIATVTDDQGLAFATMRAARILGLFGVAAAVLALLSKLNPAIGRRARTGASRGITMAAVCCGSLTTASLVVDWMKPEAQVPFAPRNSILFVRTARFSDYFQLAYLAKVPHPYGDLKSNYPPGYFLMQWVLNRLPVYGGFLVFMAVSAALFVWWAALAVRHLEGRRRIVVLAALLTAYPVLFVLDRGNSDLIIMALVAAAMVAAAAERPLVAGVLIGVAVALKLFPIVFVLCLWPLRRVRAAVGVAAGFATVTFLGGLTIGVGNPLSAYLHALNQSASMIVRNDVNMSSANGSLLAFAQQIGTVLDPTNGHRAAYDLFSTPVTLLSLGLAIGAVIWVMALRPPLWASTSVASCLYVLLPPTSFDYRLTILFVPLVIAAVGLSIMPTRVWTIPGSWWVCIGLLLGPRVFVHAAGERTIGSLTTAPLLVGLLVITVVAGRGQPARWPGASSRVARILRTPVTLPSAASRAARARTAGIAAND